MTKNGECEILKLSAKDWKQCKFHFDTELLEIYARRISVHELYNDASNVHPFLFPATLNRFLIPHDAVIKAKFDDTDIISSVKRSLFGIQEKGKCVPTDTVYVTKDTHIVEGGDIDIACEDDDDAVDDDVDEQDADDDHESTIDDDDDEREDDVEEGEPIVDEEWL